MINILVYSLSDLLFLWVCICITFYLSYWFFSSAFLINISCKSSCFLFKSYVCRMSLFSLHFSLWLFSCVFFCYNTKSIGLLPAYARSIHLSRVRKHLTLSPHRSADPSCLWIQIHLQPITQSGTSLCLHFTCSMEEMMGSTPFTVSCALGPQRKGSHFSFNA